MAWISGRGHLLTGAGTQSRAWYLKLHSDCKIIKFKTKISRNLEHILKLNIFFKSWIKTKPQGKLGVKGQCQVEKGNGGQIYDGRGLFDFG